MTTAEKCAHCDALYHTNACTPRKMADKIERQKAEIASLKIDPLRLELAKREFYALFEIAVDLLVDRYAEMDKGGPVIAGQNLEIPRKAWAEEQIRARILVKLNEEKPAA